MALRDRRQPLSDRARRRGLASDLSTTAARAVRIAAEIGVPIVPRGAATSLSGQTIGEGLILDLSKHLNRVGIVDRDRMTVKVEPGVVLDRLNAHLRPLGLMFGPDVSTSDRATIGGMIGNNSAGARSLRYGKTVDHVRSLDVILDDGERATFGPVAPEDLDAICSRNDRVGRLHASVRGTVDRHRRAISEHFPKILRRVSGYNLDEFVPGLPVRAPGWVDDPWAFNLARLIVGSEGTLAVIAGAEVKVVPIPPAQGLVILSFATIPAALDRLAEIIETGPSAVEMVDRMMLDLAASNPDYARSLSFAEGRPAAVLAAQFYAESSEELAGRAEDLARRFEGRPGVLGVRKSLSESAKDDFWKIRKAGVSLLMGMVGDSKPVAFVEDTAVNPKVLPAFYERFVEIMSRHGTRGACYGHADVGCLHIRPVINVKTEEGVDKLRSIARDVSDLVVEFGGSMSGEHGDGLARSVWNAKLFGPEVYAAFAEVKAAFDPSDRMNPGKVVASPDPGDQLRDRVEPIRAHGARGDRLRLLGPGRFRPRRGDVLGRGGLPQERRRDDVPELHDHPRREGHHPGQGQYPPAGHVPKRPSPPSGPGQRGSSTRSTRPLPPVQGLQDRVPVECRHGQIKGRVPSSEVQDPPRPAGVAPDGSYSPIEPGRLGDGPAGQRDARVPGLPPSARKAWRGSTRWPDPATLPPPSTTSTLVQVAPGPDPQGGHSGWSSSMDDCSTTYNNPQVGRGKRPRPGSGRIPESSWRVCLAAVDRRSPRDS